MNYTTITQALKGRKTYLVALSAIVGAISAFATDQITDVQMFQYILDAILASTIRNGISNQ